MYGDETFEKERHYIGERITKLRMSAGISESRLSYELGHNKNYIRTITVKHAMPSLRGLFGICEYFKISPAQFFDSDFTPIMIEIVEHLKKLDDRDLQLIVEILNRF